MHALAGQLPATGHLLNLCHDRYRFAVGFAAGLLRGMTSLPSSQSAETFRRLRDDYPNLLALCDGTTDTLDLPRFDFPELAGDRSATAIPHIPADHLAAILFTSGSTGLPQAQRKTWGKLAQNGRAEAIALGLDVANRMCWSAPCRSSTATVSNRPSCSPCTAAAPSGPASPSTPWTSPARWPPCRSPPAGDHAFPFVGPTVLSIDLPRHRPAAVGHGTAVDDAGRRGRGTHRAPLLEIYGSTDPASWPAGAPPTARRGPCCPASVWSRRLTKRWPAPAHVEGRVALSDVIELLPDNRFLLHGRHADLINIAGKRTSLAYLNHQLVRCPASSMAPSSCPTRRVPTASPGSPPSSSPPA